MSGRRIVYIARGSYLLDSLRLLQAVIGRLSSLCER